MSIDIGVSEPQPIEVVFEEVDSSMEVTLDNVPVSIELDTPPELQVSINEVYSTTGGGGSGKSPYIGGNGNWFYYNDITEQYIDSGVQAQGDDGVTFTPSVDLSGNISWTNNGGLPNPSTINIKGPAGNDGKSAYQSALDGGYLQSESQFNTDLSKVSNGQANTGNATLTTLKQVADYTTGLTFKLIGSFTPAVGTSAFSTTFDGSGNLLSTLNIKRCIIEVYATSSATSIQVGLLRINGISTNTYKQVGNLASGIFYRNNAETYTQYSLDFKGILKYVSNGAHSTTQVNDATSSLISNNGINRTIIDSNLTQIDLTLGGGATFQANSIINIYVL